MFGFFQLGYFCFTICIPNILAFWVNDWGLSSIIEGSRFRFLNVSDVFGSAEVVFVRNFPEEAPTFPEKISKFYRVIWLVRPVWSPWGPSLVSRSLCILPLVWRRFFWALDCPKVPGFLEKVSKFLEVLLQNCERRPGKSSPCLLFFSYCDGGGFIGLLPSLLQDF